MRGGLETRPLLIAVLAATIACAEGPPDPAAIRLAALSAAAAVDTLDDLGAVSDPEAPGVREAFRNSALRALEHAQAAYNAAPQQTQYAQSLSLEAAHAADQFGDALGLALEAIDRLDALEDDFDETLGRSFGIRRKPRTWDERLGLTKSLLGPAGDTAVAAALSRSFAVEQRDAASKLSRDSEGSREHAALMEDGAARSEAQAHEFESELRRQLTATAAQLAIDTAATLYEGMTLQKELQDLVQTAEARRDDAISAHRRAAEAWRQLEHP